MTATYLSLVCLSVVAEAAFSPVVLDDAVAHFTGGKESCTAGGHAGGFHHNGGSLPDDVLTFAEYHFDPPEDGCYLIEETHPLANETCADFTPQHVPITINFCKNLSTSGYIHQGEHGGKWNKLASLPFYKGWNASILLTRAGHRKGSSMSACQAEHCYWMADAFRLTYLAADCRDPAIREEMTKDDDEDTQEDDAPEVELANTDTVDTRSATTTALVTTAWTTNAPVAAGHAHESVPSMALQAHLGESHVVDGQAHFRFQPPVDGCYMIEERHPSMPEVQQAPLTVSYCKGQSAHGLVNYSNGRQERWNYVASLPFYVGEEGVLSLPASLDGHNEHEFRLTHVGARCGVKSASAQHITLRITADFSNVVDRLASFTDELLQVLSDAVGVVAERFDVKQLRAGSVVVDMSVLPAAAVYGVEAAVDHDAAGTVAASIASSVKSSELSTKICNLVSSEAAGCEVSVIANRRAVAQIEPVPMTSNNPQPQIVTKSNGQDSNSQTIIIIAAASGAVAFLGVLSVCLYVRCRRKNVKDEECTEKTVQDMETGNSQVVKDNAPRYEVTKPSDAVAEKDGNSDEASTATPVDMEDVTVTARAEANDDANDEVVSGN